MKWVLWPRSSRTISCRQLFGREVLSWEKGAGQNGGEEGIRSPNEGAKDAYQMSVEGTAKMVEAARQGTEVEEEHNDQLRKVGRKMKRPKRAFEWVRKESMSCTCHGF
uniref:Uncharacterized protein n=1 Tax=Heterosigma akashiwo TaxID=2829 RepID=A0A6V1LE96_HETAK|mmetsp:Transcript_44304/g.64818  ORF Transcript_44304/g.64818 Transcript_44304/m.64818 type:complete len:108 (-) Transcript_44304:71-394(-)